jgi:hypothetical protein
MGCMLLIENMLIKKQQLRTIYYQGRRGEVAAEGERIIIAWNFWNISTKKVYLSIQLCSTMVWFHINSFG